MGYIAKSNIAKIWSTQDNKEGQFWWQVEWSYKTVSAGVSQVNWELKACSDGKTWIQFMPTTIQISINNSLVYSASGANLDYANLSNPNKPIYYCSYKTGSFSIEHNTSGVAEFNISFNNFSADYTSFGTSTTTGKITGNFPYTACGAPTIITSPSGPITPTSSITVSWSGAAAGTANSITGYRLYYNYGSVPTTSSSSVSTSSTSYTFTAGVPDLSSHRGQRLYFKVVTVGSASGYNSPISTASSNTLINSLPNAPSRVTEIKDVYESSKANSSINIQINAGSDPQGTTTSVYYSTSVEGTYSVYSGSLKMPSQGNSQSYYFKTWDGLEFSSNYTSVILNINSKPTVELTLTPKATLSSKNKPSDTSYVVGFELESRNGANGQNNNTYTYTLEYGNTSSLGSTQTINGNGANITINDIRTYITPSLQTQYYKVSVVRNDGVENSAPASCSDIYCITPKPNIIIYNNSGLENDIGPQINGNYYFSNGIYIKYDFDEGYDGARLQGNSFSTSIVSASNLNSEYKKVEFNLTNIGSYATNHTLITQLTYRGQDISNCLAQKVYTRVEKFELSNLSWSIGSEIYSPYNLTKDYSIDFSWGVPDQRYEEYGLAEEAEYKIIFNYNNNYQQEIFARKQVDITTANNTQYYNFTNNDLFDSIIKNLSLPQSETKEIKVKTTVTNLFNEIIESNEISVRVSLQYDITQSDIIELSLNYGEDSVEVLKQDMSLNVLCEFTTYNDPQSIKIGYKTNYFNWEDITTTAEKLTTEVDEGDYLDGKKKYKAVISLIIPEISQPDVYYNFRLIVNNVAVNYNKNYNTIYHTIGLIKLLSTINYKETEKELAFSINPTNWGIDPNNNAEISTVYLEYSKSDGESGKFEINPSLFSFLFSNESIGKDSDLITIIFNPEGLDFTVLNIRLAFTIHQTTSPLTEYTTYTNTVILYNTAPTVSYRKNRIGINTVPTFDDGALTVSVYQTYNKIYLQNASSSRVINIDTGNMDGFILSGGSWDSGDNDSDITIEGTTPLNLAAIAYSGNVNDLIQDDEDIIIFVPN